MIEVLPKGAVVRLSAAGRAAFPKSNPDRRGVVTSQRRDASRSVRWGANKFPETWAVEYLEEVYSESLEEG